MYHHLLSRPDWYLALCGRLDAVVTAHRVCGVPEFMRGLRAVFVSDVHVLDRTADADIAALVEKIDACAPDVLLLGGDYGDKSENGRRFIEAVGAVRPPLGAYGVIGNNDAEAWEGRLEALRGIMARSGIEMLVNGCVRVRHNGGTIWIAGVDEHKHGRPKAAGLLPEAPAPDIYRVLLSHYPVMPDAIPDLMLSGHTHGGQFNVLGLTPFSIGFERLKCPSLPAVAVAGLRDVRGMKLLVSKGVGASRLQFRIGVRPEINRIDFE